MHQIATPAIARQSGFASKRRTAALGVLAALVGGMAFADVASAHYLTRDLAEQTARNFGQAKVNDPRTPYIFSTAVCDVDGQAVPHRRRCTVSYDTPQSRPTDRWACTERIEVMYQAHNAGDPPPNYTRYITQVSHPC